MNENRMNTYEFLVDDEMIKHEMTQKKTCLEIRNEKKTK